MAGKAANKTHASRVRAIEPRIKAFELRKAGLSYAKIGEAMGFSAPRAHQLVMGQLTQLQGELAEQVEAVRVIEIARLDDWMIALRGKCAAGDAMAIATSLRIQERRARYLGLDAPTKVAATTPDGTGPAVIRVVYEDEAGDK